MSNLHSILAERGTDANPGVNTDIILDVVTINTSILRVFCVYIPLFRQRIKTFNVSKYLGKSLSVQDSKLFASKLVELVHHVHISNEYTHTLNLIYEIRSMFRPRAFESAPKIDPPIVLTEMFELYTRACAGHNKFVSPTLFDIGGLIYTEAILSHINKQVLIKSNSQWIANALNNPTMEAQINKRIGQTLLTESTQLFLISNNDKMIGQNPNTALSDVYLLIQKLYARANFTLPPKAQHIKEPNATNRLSLMFASCMGDDIGISGINQLFTHVNSLSPISGMIYEVYGLSSPNDCTQSYGYKPSNRYTRTKSRLSKK